MEQDVNLGQVIININIYDIKNVCNILNQCIAKPIYGRNFKEWN